MQTQELTTLQIRPFTADDYSDIARIHTMNFPEFALATAEWQFEDERRPAHCRSARWVGECDRRGVGFGEYDQHAGYYHPRKFQVQVAIEPAFFLRGIGRQLYGLLLAELS